MTFRTFPTLALVKNKWLFLPIVGGMIACLSMAHGATTYSTTVVENELISGTTTSSGFQESLTGDDISVADGAFSSRAFVDPGLSGAAPILKVRTSGSTDGSYNDPNNSKQAFAIAEASNSFKATSGTQPFETAFNAGLSIDIDGSIFYDVANPLDTEFSPFRPGDNGSVTFSLTIRPESDEYYTAANSISLSSSIVWDVSGVTFGDTTISDGDNTPIGSLLFSESDTDPNTKYFTVTANVPFQAQVGVDYIMESFFQATTTIRGGTGSKSIDVDFFNSMNAAPEALEGDFGFIVVPEPSTAFLMLLAGGAGLLKRRRNFPK